MLASARLSERSVRRYARFGALGSRLLSSGVTVCAQSAVDAQRFIAVGATPDNVRVTGNVKFDLQIPAATVAAGRQHRVEWGGDARPVWIAGSTREGEEGGCSMHTSTCVVVIRTLCSCSCRDIRRASTRSGNCCASAAYATARAVSSVGRKPTTKSCWSTPSASCRCCMPPVMWHSSAAAWCRSAATTCSAGLARARGAGRPAPAEHARGGDPAARGASAQNRTRCSRAGECRERRPTGVQLQVAGGFAVGPERDISRTGNRAPAQPPREARREARRERREASDRAADFVSHNPSPLIPSLLGSRARATVRDAARSFARFVARRSRGFRPLERPCADSGYLHYRQATWRRRLRHLLQRRASVTPTSMNSTHRLPRRCKPSASS